MTKILIISGPDDLHAYLVAETLKIKGVQPTIWFTPDFPANAVEAILMEKAGKGQMIRNSGVDLVNLDADVVWYRRANFGDAGTSALSLDPSDEHFATRENCAFRKGLYSVISPNAFWVNPVVNAARAENKIYQHKQALDAGLEMPPTLYGNDPNEIRAFIRRFGGKVIYKNFSQSAWWRDESANTNFATFTTVISEEQIPDDETLKATAGIFQPIIRKDHELRVTMMGNSPFAVKINSQQTKNGTLDWRRAYGELEMELTTLPEAIVAGCRNLMRRLGIVFGAFDFIVTPEGKYVFLEVNQMGQFAFLEPYIEFPLVDAFCEFLLQGNVDFELNRNRTVVRKRDIVEKCVRQMQLEMKARIVPIPELQIERSER